MTQPSKRVEEIVEELSFAILTKKIFEGELEQNLTTTLTQLEQQAVEDIKEIVDRNIYALEETLKKSKELGVAVGHKRVYARIKLISDYEGQLKAWEEIQETLTTEDNHPQP